MTDVSPTPAPVPVLPKTWTPTTVATLVSGIAVFILGVLTSAGVVLPGGVSTEVQTITGSLTAIAGAISPLIALLSTHSVQKAALKAAVTTIPSV